MTPSYSDLLSSTLPKSGNIPRNVVLLAKSYLYTHDVIPPRVLLVMNTFPNTICRNKPGAPIPIEAGYLNIGLTDKPAKVSWAVPIPHVYTGFSP